MTVIILAVWDNGFHAPGFCSIIYVYVKYAEPHSVVKYAEVAQIQRTYKVFQTMHIWTFF